MQTRRILLADSHDDGREALAAVLEDLGHRVIARATFSEVLTTIECQVLDAVIIDRWLVGLDIKDIGVLAHRSPIPILVLCTHRVDLEMSSIGPAVLLPKPCGMGLLLSVLAQVERCTSDRSSAARASM